MTEAVTISSTDLSYLSGSNSVFITLTVFIGDFNNYIFHAHKPVVNSIVGGFKVAMVFE